MDAEEYAAWDDAGAEKFCWLAKDCRWSYCEFEDEEGIRVFAVICVGTAEVGPGLGLGGTREDGREDCR